MPTLTGLSNEALIALLNKLEIAVERVKDELGTRLDDLQAEAEMLADLLGVDD